MPTDLSVPCAAFCCLPQVMDSMMNVVTLMAKRGLRCICLSYCDFDLEDFDR